MRIVVLDGYTVNPGDLDWSGLEALGGCTVYDRTPGERILERARGAQIVLTNKVPLWEETLSRLPDLRYIGVLATGYNVVDPLAARKRGIPVTNVPSYSTSSVAQMVFAHLLNLTQHAGDHSRGVAEGRWFRSADFCYWESTLIEIEGLTMGIIGFGRIGRAVAARALAFGMRVLAHTSSPRPHDGVTFVGLERLLAESDVVSLHCPLTSATRGLINADRLRLMKPSAFLINTARGPIVDETALAAALEEGRIAGAGLDVLSKEPPGRGNPLVGARNCAITPHIAWATRAARKRLLRIAVENVAAFLAGHPRNVVNP